MLKKILCTLLVLMFLLTGCGGNTANDESREESNEESSDASDESSNSSDESSNTSDESPDNSDVSEPEGNGEDYITQIDKLVTDGANRDMNKKNLLISKKYTTSVAAHSDYPDNTNILTNGTLPLIFNSNGEWAGYVLQAENATNVIDIDLGKSVDGIMDFSVRSMDLIDFAIYAPKEVNVYVAGTDKEYVKVGTAHRPDGKLSQNNYIDYSLYLQGSVSARYIRYEIVANKKGWCFIGEISAMSYSDKYDEYSSLGSSLNDYYGYTDIPVIEAEEYWAEDSDFNRVQNLIKNKKPIISATEYVQNDLLTDWYNSRNIAMLTNGSYATESTIGDSNWLHITRGGQRIITVDMTKLSAVSGFKAGFLHEAGSGVQYPSDIKIKLSADGKAWQTVYTHKGIEAKNTEEIYRYDCDFEKEYKARYVQISFTVNTHTYMDEFEVKAKKNTAKAIDIVADKEEEDNGDVPVYDGYAMPDDLYGVHNMLLSYHCYTDANNKSAEEGLITEEEYLPYVAYLDKEGNIKDTFFDGFLYLPYVRHIHGEGSNFGRSAQGWKTYVDDMFYENRNMDALNACAEKVYGELGITDQKLKVFTSILYTFPKLYDGSVNSFGDINGDGVAESFADIEDRKTAIKWIMDEEYNRFKAKNYKNLEFCGFYWFEEGIDYSDPHEEELIAFAVEYAHKLGVKIFWIPYRTAPGVKDWKELGFDVACLQPNYMFGGLNPDVLYETAERASGLGMCVEIEINDPNNLLEANKYTEYLIAGAQTGYMNALKMYYQVGVPGAFYTACYSDKADVRRLYDDTYLFAKEKFDPIWPDEVIISETPLEFTYNENGTVTGTIDISMFADISGKLAITLSPKYGSVKLSGDSFTYYPPEGCTIADSFEIAFDLGYGEPVPTTVNILAK